MYLTFNLASLLDDAKCFELVRSHRWPDGVRCVKCDAHEVVRNGHDEKQPHRQRYLCKCCGARFDDLSETVLASRHQSLTVWFTCLYLMGLNLSNRQIAQELNLNENDVQEMTTQLRDDFNAKSPDIVLSGEVEADEVYIIAGHKGNSAAVEKKGAKEGAIVSAARRGAARWKRRSRPFSA